MPEKYDDKNKRKRVLVITGSGKGIGRTVATEFAKAGYYVMINNLAISEKASTTKKKTTYGETLNTTSNSLDKQASPYFTLEEYEIADLYLKGAYHCIREAAKQMVITAYEQEEEKQNITTTKIAAGGGGAYSIINISSP